jgi:hypothetical protein
MGKSKFSKKDIKYFGKDSSYKNWDNISNNRRFLKKWKTYYNKIIRTKLKRELKDEADGRNN